MTNRAGRGRQNNILNFFRRRTTAANSTTNANTITTGSTSYPNTNAIAIAIETTETNNNSDAQDFLYDKSGADAMEDVLESGSLIKESLSLDLLSAYNLNPYTLIMIVCTISLHVRM